jgi:hypothetical protein
VGKSVRYSYHVISYFMSISVYHNLYEVGHACCRQLVCVGTSHETAGGHSSLGKGFQQSDIKGRCNMNKVLLSEQIALKIKTFRN